MAQQQRSNSKRKTIIWSVDPTMEPADCKYIVRELKKWSQQFNADVLPVTVFSNAIAAFPVDIPIPWKTTRKAIGEHLLAKFMKMTGTDSFLAPEILFSVTGTKKSMATELAKFALRKDAMVIFANTRARRTALPVRIGGFVEKLISASRVPLLLFNDKAVPSTTISSILFPTDFSRDSRRAFEIMKPWVKSFGAKVWLFNQLETVPVYISDVNEALGKMRIDFDKIAKDVYEERSKKMKSMWKALSREGISCDAQILKQKKSSSEDIVSFANRKRVDLIAMSTSESGLSKFLLGSIALDVLLSAECPVLIFHKPRVILQETDAKPEKSVSRNRAETTHAITTAASQKTGAISP